MQHVKPVERFFTDESGTEQAEAGVGAVGDHVDAADREQLLPRPLVAEDRRRAGHVRPDRDGPDGKLIPRQQIAREGEEQREQQQNHADHPVEFPRRLVTAGEEDAIHVQPCRDHHRVGTPAMQLPQDAEARHVAEGEDVVVGPFQGGPVIEHQQHAGDRLHQKQEERHSAHAPREGEGNALLLDRHGMEVKKEIGEHHHDPIPPVKRHRMTEDALPNLGVADRFADGHKSNFVGGLRPRSLACRMTGYTVT